MATQPQPTTTASTDTNDQQSTTMTATITPTTTTSEDHADHLAAPTMDDVLFQTVHEILDMLPKVTHTEEYWEAHAKYKEEQQRILDTTILGGKYEGSEGKQLLLYMLDQKYKKLVE
jgi:hypothetical protein